MACKHTEWLHLANHGESSIVQQTGRYRSLVRILPFPSSQRPALVLLLESRNGRILTANEPCTSAAPGSAHLSLDSETVLQDNPVFVVSAFPVRPKRRSVSHKERKCCSIIGQHVLSEPPGASESLIYSRLLFPLVDVYCFVYHDTSDLENIQQSLYGVVQGRKASAIRCVLPEILIVLTKEGIQQAQASKELLANLNCLSPTLIKKDELVSAKGHLLLYRHLRKISNRMRRKRANRGLLFSATHQMAFTEIAFDNLLLTEPFDFINASRIQNPATTDLTQHLIDFVDQVRSAQDLTTFAAETIASSFLLDHYTREMHAFKPSDVFHALYRDTCAYVARLTARTDRLDGHLLPSAFVDLILKNMCSLFKEYVEGMSAVEIHRRTLKKYALKWEKLRSEKTCFVCLRRIPQFGTKCRHRICEICIKTFGETSDDPWLFNASTCFLCQLESQIVVRVHAPTAGIGILCIDGGGVRGIIPTTILELLEERIGLPVPIQEHFKRALGISAGGLIIPAMFLKGWSAAKCTTAFESLADVAFQRGQLASFPLLSTVGKMVAALFSDAMYRARYLERVLRETYGSDTKILDPSYATGIGAKIGLPVATISKPSTLLFTNYNGVGEEALRLGTELTACDELLLTSNSARGCTAAPAYFKPKYIEGVGPLQDAGVLHNNPLTIALSELHAVYPTISTPQYLINLGTGTARSPDGPQEDKALSVFGNNFIVRLFRSYMSLLRGRRPWEEFRRSMKRSPTTDRCFRLDLTFEGPEPKLDDIKIIPELKDMVRADEALSLAIDEISRCIIASLFYFELDSIPEKRNGEFWGVGRIFCFRRRSDPALAALATKLSRLSARFIINGAKVPGEISDPSFWDEDGNFQKRICFKTSGEILISLREEGFREYPISGAPFSVDKLVKTQGLNAHFGAADHRKRKRSCMDEGHKERKRKRFRKNTT
ncbi:patatin-like phospholipase-like protein [Rhypophila decipiens]